ncbi:DUF4097 family beta strand repeat-containing protein [Streptomyces montanisoli]|uniref:DUF4097 family beta strand repeat protein n=1 Tax=Streptomyces montanisoli TaxID=2798581 RepID=A0A940MDH4_9ACTN|nr:DUF4097 family beta strand repeat-containing protein [Streptomyces montanisoli]MBP0458381.1 DUF4097 family beta strand repeat protein [Streptomyces montanisoli]
MTTARARRRIRAALAVCGAVAVAATVSGCGDDGDGGPVQKHTFAFSGTKLTIKAGDSGVRVAPGDVKGVHVERQVHGWVVLGHGPDATWRLDGHTLTLDVKCSGFAADCGARQSVLVPRGVAVTVESTNGKVEASGFATPLSVRTDNGSAEARDSSGPVTLRSRNGSVAAYGITGKKVTASSDNGRIHLGFSAVPDRVDVTSRNGGIRVDLPAGHTAYAVDATVRNGSTDIGVPRDGYSTHTVEAHADNGGISVHAAN